MSPFRRLTVEVERKFRCDPGCIARLKSNQGSPPFHTLNYLGQRSFEDTYYDYNDSLSSNGIYVRKRSGKWQAKVREAGDYINSQFGELSNPEDIARVVCKFSSNTSSPTTSKAKDFGLQSTAQYTTVRNAWKADNKFEIVLDTTDFGHCVGEVELQELMEIDDSSSHHRESQLAARQAMGKEMDRQIEAFMQWYSWAFPAGKPVGKLSAYFEWKKKGRVERSSLLCS